MQRISHLLATQIVTSHWARWSSPQLLPGVSESNVKSMTSRVGLRCDMQCYKILWQNLYLTNNDTLQPPQPHLITDVGLE